MNQRIQIESNPENLIRRYNISGARRLSNIIWAFILTIGGIYFLLTGVSSYFQNPLFPFIHSNNIIFIPQGLTMCFYGSLSFFLGFYLCLTIAWRVGSGFNEFNKKTDSFRIFRWGFPGKNRKIDYTYSLKDIEAVRMEIVDGFNPKRTIYIRFKEKKEIPLTRVNQSISIEELEKQASDLAFFLKVSLDE